MIPLYTSVEYENFAAELKLHAMKQTPDFTETLLSTARTALSDNIPLLEELLSGMEFGDIVLGAILEVARTVDVPLYRTCYMIELSGQLLNITGKSREAAEEVLYSMNFNNKGFLEYMKGVLKENIYACETSYQQLLQARGCLKIIYQRSELPGFHYDSRQRSVKVFMLDWLEHEIDYLEDKINYSSVLLQYEGGCKVKLNISVKELAVLLGLLMKDDMIQTDSEIEIVEFVARHFATKDRAELSAENLLRYMHNLPAVPEPIGRVLLSFIRLFNIEEEGAAVMDPSFENGKIS